MANELQLKCHVESGKVLWFVVLVLASVLAIQHFELPYRDSMLSLLSTGKAYLSFNVWSKGNVQIPEFGDVSTSAERLTEMEHSHFSSENGFANISPSVISRAEVNVSSSSKNGTIAACPVASLTFRQDGVNAAMASPPQLVLPSYKDIGVHGVASGLPNEEAAVDSKNSEVPRSFNAPSVDHLSITNSPLKKTPQTPVDSVVSIREMNNMLRYSRVSSFSKHPVWPSAVDQELLDARFQIERPTIMTRHPSLYAPVYRNISMFARSYELMEQRLKVYIYKDGKEPVFHQPRLRGIYASEGWFMKLLKASNQFVTDSPSEAHLFYLPFSSQLLGEYVYVPNSHSFDDIIRYLRNYLDTVKATYPFWNRTDGEDHFLVACHDWAPIETRKLMANCIRALCNSDVKEGFQFGKDVSLPETYVHSPQNPMREIGGMPPSKRKILAFFAGQMHGNVRPILLKHWENKDPDMKIVGRMKRGYTWYMKSSKYCICAKGYEVNSPRVVEAILYGCVPVIISDNFVPPFFEIFKWESFAVFVAEKDIPNLKNVLGSISERRYRVMQHRVKQVRQHFVWYNKPVKYDIFHMILHSVWYNRVFRMLPG